MLDSEPRNLYNHCKLVEEKAIIDTATNKSANGLLGSEQTCRVVSVNFILSNI